MMLIVKYYRNVTYLIYLNYYSDQKSNITFSEDIQAKLPRAAKALKTINYIERSLGLRGGDRGKVKGPGKMFIFVSLTPTPPPHPTTCLISLFNFQLRYTQTLHD